MLDIFLSACLSVVTIVMAYLGVHVTLHPPNESPRAQRWYKIGFLACGAVAVSLVVTQTVRSAHSQRNAANQVEGLRQDVQGARSEAQSARMEAQGAKQEVETESVRRQQAEKDLSIIVQKSGRATRLGISEDIRKTPLKVEVNGKPADTPERKRIREALGNFVRRGMALRDRCVTDSPEKQLEVEAQAWFEEVQQFLQSNLDSSYLSQFLLTHPDPLRPAHISEEMLSLWYGLNERIQSLSAFIDQLK